MWSKTPWEISWQWILLRGFGREMRHWDDFPQRWRDVRPQDQVIPLELPGAGTRHYETVPWSLDQLVGDLHQRLPLSSQRGLLCLSLGGMVGLHWCHRFPQDFQALVVINSSSRSLSPLTQRLRPQAWPQLGRILAEPDGLVREQQILKLTSRLYPECAAKAQRSRDYFLQYPMKRTNALRQLWLAARFQPPPSLSLPLLVLSSAQDGMVDPRCSQRIAARYQAHHEVHPQAGHDLPLDDPDWVIEKTQEWFSAPHAQRS